MAFAIRQHRQGPGAPPADPVHARSSSRSIAWACSSRSRASTASRCSTSSPRAAGLVPRHVRHVLGRRARAVLDLHARHHAVRHRVDRDAAAHGRRPQARPAQQRGRAGPQARSTSTPATARSSSRPSRRGSPRATSRACRAAAPRSSPTRASTFHLLTVLTMTTGTAVIMWFGELITEKGIGNGSSMIIFAGIVAAMPDAITQFLAGGGGGDVGGLTVVVHGPPRRRHDRRHLLLRTRAPANPGPVHEAAGRAKNVLGRAELPAAQDQRLGRHPADLRVVDPHVPAADRQHGELGLDAGVRRGAAPGRLALQPDLHDPRRVLRVLLHVGRVQPGRRRRQPQEVGRLHPGHSSRQEHRAVHRARAVADHVRRCAVPVGRLHDPGAAAEVPQRAVQLRWHGPPDRRRCRARYRAADRVAPDHAQLRRLRRTQGSADPRPRRAATALQARASCGSSSRARTRFA